MAVKQFVLFLVVVSLLFACGDNSTDQESNPTKDEMISKIKQLEDSITSVQTGSIQTVRIPDSAPLELINRLLAFYHSYPNDVSAAQCLDKVHMIYSSIGNYVKEVQYADTLLAKYPKYINRAMVIESQASTYDVLLKPRDISKIRYYYELLLKENPKMDKEKKEGITQRLAHLDLTFEEYIDYNASKGSNK